MFSFTWHKVPKRVRRRSDGKKTFYVALYRDLRAIFVAAFARMRTVPRRIAKWLDGVYARVLANAATRAKP